MPGSTPKPNVKNHAERYLATALNDFFAMSPDMFCIVSNEGYFLQLNPSWEAILGYTAEELKSKPLFYFLHPDDLRSTVKEFAEEIKGKNVLKFVNRYRCKDGSYKWLEWRGKANPENNTVIGIARDITAQKSAADALYESEDHFRSIFNESPIGIALIDSLTGKVKAVNPKFAGIAGRKQEEMLLIDWMSITHPDDIQEDLEKTSLMNEGKIPGFRMEKSYIKPDGTIVWISMTVASIYVRDKTKPLHLKMIEDISKQKQIENDLKTINEHLEMQVLERTAKLQTALKE
jgi:PAS domain S-box-containing protein